MAAPEVQSSRYAVSARSLREAAGSRASGSATRQNPHIKARFVRSLIQR